MLGFKSIYLNKFHVTQIYRVKVGIFGTRIPQVNCDSPAFLLKMYSFIEQIQIVNTDSSNRLPLFSNKKPQFTKKKQQQKIEI